MTGEGQYLRAVRATRAVPERESTKIWNRMRLRTIGGGLQLDRWGPALEWLGGVFVHHMQAPDPGRDLHDHPWSMISIVLWGGYSEHRALVREAQDMAIIAEAFPQTCTPGVVEERRWLSARLMRLDECHTIVELHSRNVWTIVLRGPRRRGWGFYTASEGYVDEKRYKTLPNGKARGVVTEIGT